MDNVSFKGGFLIENITPRVWNTTRGTIKKSKCIFPNFNERGDKFFVVDDCYDREMAEFVRQKKLKFKFFPDINKKQFNPHEIEDTRNAVKEQTSVIDTWKGLRKFLKKFNKPFTFPTYKWKENDYVEKTMDTFNLDPTKCVIKTKNSITHIYSKNGKKILSASPNNEMGMNFVYINSKNNNPKTKNESSKMFMINSNGDTLEFGISQITDFQKMFLKSVQIDINRKQRYSLK